MAAKLLDDGDFRRLIDAPTLKDEEAILREKGLLSESEELPLDRVEFLLEKKMMTELSRLRPYVKGPVREFFNSVLRKYEIRDIKNILRRLNERDTVINDRNLLVITKENPLYPKVDNIKDYVEQMENKEYYRALQSYEDEDPDRILFYMEMSLDRLYYRGVMEALEHLSGDDEKAARKLMDPRIDMLNLIWIYRGKKNYKLYDEELYNFTILGSKTMGKEELRKYTSCTVEEFLGKMEDSPYGFLFLNDNPDLYMNRREYRKIYVTSLKEFRRSPFDLGKILSYNFLITVQTKDITTVLEAKRFGMTTERIQDILIRTNKGSDRTWL